MYATLVRTNKTKKSTLGSLFVFNDKHNLILHLATVELPWKDNQVDVSCIPEGEYTVEKRFSEKFKHHLHILDVPGRTLILIHVANFVRQLMGCIAPGLTHKDIDHDGKLDVISSRVGLDHLLNIVPESFKIRIV